MAKRPKAERREAPKSKAAARVDAQNAPVDRGQYDNQSSVSPPIANPLEALAERATYWLARPSLLFAIVLFIWLIPAIFNGQSLSFRDVSHFYLPLYEYTTTRLAAFELPLWNPLMLTGVPLVGDNTSALFYPGRIIFLLGLSTEWGLIVYFLMHLVLAGLGARYAALRAGIKPEFAGLAGLAYALSAPVVQQYTNPVFLVGAAWLPWAVSGLFQTMTGGSRRAIALTAMALAMPVLGGDPQSTMHALMIGFAYWCFLFISHLRARRKQKSSEALDVKSSMLEPVKTKPIVLACGLAFAAALIQVLPTLHWSKHSGRSAEAPFGIARVLAGKAVEPTDRAWYEYPTPGTHAKLIYNYSTGPWNVLELAYPNVWGPPKPIVGRMSRLISSEEMFWTTSIYCGLLAFITACATLINRQWNRWWVLACGGLLLAFGHFGILSGIQHVMHATPTNDIGQLEPAVGTPYWLLVTFFPGYASFRYPSKWMPAVALGFSVAMALWFSRATLLDIRRARRIAMGIALLGVGLLALSLVPSFRQWIVEVEKPLATIDKYYGPLNISRGFFAVQMACLQGILLSGFLILRFKRTMDLGMDRDQSLTRHITLFLACDFLIAGLAWIDFVPMQRETLAQLEPWQQTALKREGAVGSPAILRTLDDNTLFAPWTSCSSDNRCIEVDVNEQRTLMALWNLTHHVVMVNSSPTIAPRIHTTLWTVAADIAAKRNAATTAAKAKERSESPDATPKPPLKGLGEVSALWGRMMRWLSVGAVVTTGGPVIELREGTKQLMLTVPDWQWLDNALPTVRWYSDWEPLPGSGDHPTQTWEKLVPRLFDEETETLPAFIGLPLESLPEKSKDSDMPASATYNVLKSEPESVQVEVENPSAGWLYFHVFQDGYWQADVVAVNEPKANQRIPSTPINMVGQGIFLPAGKWQVELRYRPQWVGLGTVASTIGWLGIGFLAYRSRRPPLPSRN